METALFCTAGFATAKKKRRKKEERSERREGEAVVSPACLWRPLPALAAKWHLAFASPKKERAPNPVRMYKLGSTST